MATVYFLYSGTTDDWDNPLNWWTNNTGTIPYGSIPVTNDAVVLVDLPNAGASAAITLSLFNTASLTAASSSDITSNITIASGGSISITGSNAFRWYGSGSFTTAFFSSTGSNYSSWTATHVNFNGGQHEAGTITCSSDYTLTGGTGYMASGAATSGTGYTDVSSGAELKAGAIANTSTTIGSGGIISGQVGGNLTSSGTTLNTGCSVSGTTTLTGSSTIKGGTFGLAVVMTNSIIDGGGMDTSTIQFNNLLTMNNSTMPETAARTINCTQITLNGSSGSGGTILSTTVTITGNVIVSGGLVGNSGGTGPTISGSITVSNSGLMQGGAVAGGGTFGSTTAYISGGTIAGACTFTGVAGNVGGALGSTAVFSNTATMGAGTIAGGATFNNSSTCTGGTMNGTATFNNSSVATAGTFNAAVTFNDSSHSSGITLTSSTVTYNTGTYGSGTMGGVAYSIATPAPPTPPIYNPIGVVTVF